VGAAGGRSLRLRRDWGSGGRPGRTAKPRVKRRTGDDGGAAEATTTVWTAKKVGGSAATEPLGGWEGRPVPLPIGRMDWWNGHSRGAGKGSSTRRIGTAELKEREPLSKQRKREAVGFQQTWEPPHSAAFG